MVWCLGLNSRNFRHNNVDLYSAIAQLKTDIWEAMQNYKMMFMYRQKEKRLKKIDDEIPEGEIGSIKFSEVWEHKTPVGDFLVYRIPANVQKDVVNSNDFHFRYREIMEENRIIHPA